MQSGPIAAPWLVKTNYTAVEARFSLVQSRLGCSSADCMRRSGADAVLNASQNLPDENDGVSPIGTEAAE